MAHGVDVVQPSRVAPARSRPHASPPEARPSRVAPRTLAHEYRCGGAWQGKQTGAGI